MQLFIRNLAKRSKRNCSNNLLKTFWHPIFKLRIFSPKRLCLWANRTIWRQIHLLIQEMTILKWKIAAKEMENFIAFRNLKISLISTLKSKIFITILELKIIKILQIQTLSRQEKQDNKVSAEMVVLEACHLYHKTTNKLKAF